MKTSAKEDPSRNSQQSVSSTTLCGKSVNQGLPLLKEWSEMIKVEHTVFALPFAMSGLVLASKMLPSLSSVLWTILAFGSARAAAMTLNRLIDANIDALNPRTSDRAVAAGRISKWQAAMFAAGSFALMLFAASHLPPICLWLSPIAIFWLSFYSFTKRFTWLCHLVLGIALGGAALGGWVAASGQISGIAPWLLSVAVATWVAGFDIIYACQDIDFDRQQRLHSMPSRFGLATALRLSSLLHVLTVSALAALGVAMQAGIVYWAGISMVASMLVWEHTLVKPSDLSRVNAAFFNVNGFVSIAAFFTILLDKILKLG